MKLHDLRSEDRMSRREFLKMIRLKNHEGPFIDKEKCTGCGLCTMDCPTKALILNQSSEKDTYQLLFRQEACNACGVCEKSCPENCLQLEQILGPDRRGDAATIIFEDRISRCHECDIPLFPLAMVSHLKSKISLTGGIPFPFDLCPSCRIKIQVARDWVTEE